MKMSTCGSGPRRVLLFVRNELNKDFFMNALERHYKCRRNKEQATCTKSRNEEGIS